MGEPHHHHDQRDHDEAEQLARMRHSCAHLMAAAIQDLWPEARFGVGPATENGFFYDGMSMRQPVAGTVARDEMPREPEYETGKDADLVIFDDDLSASQVKNLEEILDLVLFRPLAFILVFQDNLPVVPRLSFQRCPRHRNR